MIRIWTGHTMQRERMADKVQWACVLGKLEAVGDEINRALGLSTIIEVPSGQGELGDIVSK